MPKDLFQEQQATDLFAQQNIAPQDQSQTQQSGTLSSLASNLIPSELSYMTAAGRGVGQDILNLGTGGVNAVLWALNKLNPQRQAAYVNAPDIVSGSAHPFVSKLFQYLDPITLALLPEAKIPEALGAATKLGRYIAPVLEKAIPSGLLGATYGMASSQPQPGVSGAIGAGIGGIAGALGIPASLTQGALSDIAKAAAKPGAEIRSPEQVQALANALQTATGGVPGSFGDMANLPGMSRFFYSTLGKIPGVGTAKTATDLMNQVRATGQDILSDLGGAESLPTANVTLRNSLANKLQENVNTTNELYEGAKKQGENIKAPLLQTKQLAKSLLDMAKDPTALAPLGDEASKLMPILNQITEMKGNVPFSTAIDNIKRLGQLSHKNWVDGDDFAAKIYGQLRDAHEGDLINKAEEKGNEDAYQALLNARQYHAENVAPLKSDDIRSIISQKNPTESVSRALISGDNQRILPMLSESDRKLVALDQMAKAIKPGILDEKEIISSPRLINAYDAMKDVQGQLIPQETQSKIEKLRALHQISSEAAKAEHPAYTGGRLAGDWVKYLMGGLGGAAFIPGAQTPALSALAAIPLMGKAAKGALTSDWLRNAYITGKVPSVLQPGILARLFGQAGVRAATQPNINQQEGIQ
jgi:hypothetical protein